MLVRFRAEQVSKCGIPLVDRLMGVAEKLADVPVGQAEMVQKRRLHAVFGRRVFAGHTLCSRARVTSWSSIGLHQFPLARPFPYH